MIFKSTKTYYNLPCSHQQWKDTDDSCVVGSGQCSKTHGYSRSFSFEFSCNELDDYGWVVGFGSLKPIKKWLEYMFDHTSLFEASDPRIKDVLAFNETLDIPLYNIRVLPSGVSMEQTALFVASYLNPYILDVTDGRCWISRLEVRENDKNSGILEMDYIDAQAMKDCLGNRERLPKETVYEYISPKQLVERFEFARGSYE